MLIAFSILQFFIVIIMVTLIMMQNQEVDSLRGIGLSAANPNSALTGRSKISFATKLIGLFGLLFLLNSLVVAKLNANSIAATVGGKPKDVKSKTFEELEKEDEDLQDKSPANNASPKPPADEVKADENTTDTPKEESE